VFVLFSCCMRSPVVVLVVCHVQCLRALFVICYCTVCKCEKHLVVIFTILSSSAVVPGYPVKMIRIGILAQRSLCRCPGSFMRVCDATFIYTICCMQWRCHICLVSSEEVLNDKLTMIMSRCAAFDKMTWVAALLLSQHLLHGNIIWSLVYK